MWDSVNLPPEEAEENTPTILTRRGSYIGRGSVTIGSYSFLKKSLNILTSLGRTDHDDMCDEVEKLHQVCHRNLHIVNWFSLTPKQQIKSAQTNAQSFQKRLLFAEEQSRRRAELCTEAVQAAEEARKENRILMRKIASLQFGLETLTDGDIKREMCSIYHELERWVFNHFGGKDLKSSDPGLEYIQSAISDIIYRKFWNRFAVGCEDSLSAYLHRADCVIRCDFPSHISRHWRYAMSTAVLSLEKEKLQSQCKEVLEWVESSFAHLTERQNRKAPLLGIIQRCIQFKHTLECQEDTYRFWCSKHQTPFRHDEMRRTNEDDSFEGLVEFSMWPSLRKAVQGDEWAVIEKEVVRQIAPTASLDKSSDGEASQQVSEDLVEL
ncbi:hypothetical protein N7535_005161 [Penicillium sp. DV-2018c]|nr:hypothetical protein N7461_008740 [Penicillium sp. DV-2018c]KAJ5571501.1 hypothetical protein N7535_005161 [Penicillium sp. DV-2018c]